MLLLINRNRYENSETQIDCVRLAHQKANLKNFNKFLI